jgi:hypothetical protein
MVDQQPREEEDAAVEQENVVLVLPAQALLSSAERGACKGMLMPLPLLAASWWPRAVAQAAGMPWVCPLVVTVERGVAEGLTWQKLSWCSCSSWAAASEPSAKPC